MTTPGLPPSIIRRAPSRTVRNDPNRLTSITLRNASALITLLTPPVLSTLIISPSAMMPALAKTTLIPPKVLTAVSISFSTSASSVMLQATPTASPPSALISPTTVSRPSWFMSPRTTLAPSLASNLATAAPMPLAPPVMTITLPLTSMIRRLFAWVGSESLQGVAKKPPGKKPIGDRHSYRNAVELCSPFHREVGKFMDNGVAPPWNRAAFRRAPPLAAGSPRRTREAPACWFVAKIMTIPSPASGGWFPAATISAPTSSTGMPTAVADWP